MWRRREKVLYLYAKCIFLRKCIFLDKKKENKREKDWICGKKVFGLKISTWGKLWEVVEEKKMILWDKTFESSLKSFKLRLLMQKL